MKKPFNETAGPEMEKWLEEYELQRISSDIVERTVTIVIAGLGLIAALAWDETLHELFKHFFGDAGTLGEKALYALIVTIIAVVTSVVLGKYAIKRTKKNFRKK